MIPTPIRRPIGLTLAVTILSAAGLSQASAWTRAEIDAAVKKNVDVQTLRSCVANPNEELVQRVETKDFNKDGVDEIVVYSVVYSPSRCAGLNSRQADLLISDREGWHVTSVPLADDLKLQARSDSA